MPKKPIKPTHPGMPAAPAMPTTMPILDSKDYVIKILSERAQLLEKNIQTLAMEIGRLNMLKNGGSCGLPAQDQEKVDEAQKSNKVIDFSAKRKADTNAKQAQKLLAPPETEKKPEAEMEEVEKKPEAPERTDTASMLAREKSDADGNIKDPKDE